MLSIIWSILKIIGIILLVILGLLLAIFLLVLFVPLRYELKGNGSYEKEEGSSPDFLVKARVSWLLRIVCVSIRAGKEGLKMRVRLFGIPFLRSGGTKKEKKKRKIFTVLYPFCGVCDIMPHIHRIFAVDGSLVEIFRSRLSELWPISPL